MFSTVQKAEEEDDKDENNYDKKSKHTQIQMASDMNRLQHEAHKK